LLSEKNGTPSNQKEFLANPHHLTLGADRIPFGSDSAACKIPGGNPQTSVPTALAGIVIPAHAEFNQD
jgi:hypothetical protein